ncbi:MAG: GGDEF domain-containing protein [Planctomycetota bacterium]
MNPAARTESRRRGSRARLLLVGGGEPMRELSRILRRHLDHVSESPDLYLAVAEVAQSSAREPIGVVAVSADADGYDPRVVVDAFARIDPSVQLLLVVNRAQESFVADAIAEGFEHSITLPPDGDEILGVLSELGLAGAVRPAPAPPAAASATPAPATEPRIPDPRSVVEIAIEHARAELASRGGVAATTASAPERDGHAAEIERTRPLPRAAAAIDPPATPEPNIEHRHGDAPPGDIDLVRALSDGGDFHAAAVRVLRHHLGTADVRFLPEPRPEEADAIEAENPAIRRAAVTRGGHRYGSLISATLDAATLAAWAEWLSHWLRLEESHRELRRLAWTDELTGAGNRRAFETTLADTIARARRERQSFSLLYFDIDDFKRYNDRFGHAAGDRVLRETVEVLRACVRKGDQVFRIGGDEFVVLFCDPSGPRQGGNGIPQSIDDVLRRFQKSVCELCLPQLGLDGPGTVTVSAGISAFPWDGHDAASLVDHADRLALESKRAGKNVITFGPGARRMIDEEAAGK